MIKNLNIEIEFKEFVFVIGFDTISEVSKCPYFSVIVTSECPTTFPIWDNRFPFLHKSVTKLCLKQ